jgi:hypothetical protein
MLIEPLNDGDCLGLALAQVPAAMARTDVRELAARLGSVAEVVRYLRRLPQLDDTGGPGEGPRIACDVPQRVRVPAPDPNCLERSLFFLALAELLDPPPWRTLTTIDVTSARGRERHTFPVENDTPVCLDPVVPRAALTAGLSLIRNARGERGALFTPIGSLQWVVGLVGDVAQRAGGMVAARHHRALRDVQRIAQGLAPLEPAAIAWALDVAFPAALTFGPAGSAALVAAAEVLDGLTEDDPSKRLASAHGGRR